MTMNRRILDIAVPVAYAIAVMITALAAGGGVTGAVTIIGALLVGLYFAAIRRNVQS